jgi:hypothetical protein
VPTRLNFKYERFRGLEVEHHLEIAVVSVFASNRSNFCEVRTWQGSVNPLVRSRLRANGSGTVIDEN